MQSMGGVGSACSPRSYAAIFTAGGRTGALRVEQLPDISPPIVFVAVASPERRLDRI